MPNDWNIDIAGQQGQPGVQGIAGGTFPDAPSDNNTYGRVNATWGRTVNVAGDTMTGGLNISTSSSAIITLKKSASGQYNIIYGYTGSASAGLRWSIIPGDSQAESGSNNGSHFQIYRYGDNGAQIDAPLSINRANGVVYANGISCPTLYGNVNITGQGNIQGNLYSNIGINYAGLSDGNWIGFTYGSGYAWVIINQTTNYALAPVSDERLKQDIERSTYDCLATVARLPLFQFRWKDRTIPGKPQPAKEDEPIVPIGFVAQRVHEIVPSCVINGDELRQGNRMTMWNIEPNNMMALLTGAVQQLLKRVEELEAQLRGTS